ncbi:MAG: multidrug ABC transporter ATP-binding protein [Desulfurococcales archaeon ex4484_42]|nr:MAG: multidrug ABC transporter ATP-binding protein [Desulfurococcales archaeon ex4484_42]
MEYVVVVKDLVKVYPGNIVGINGVSFNVDGGEIYGLIGPNGSGKTTTLRILATIIKPTSGSALIAGYDVVKNAHKVRSLISYLPEEAGAYRDMKGVDYIKFILSLRFKGRELDEAIEEAIKISGLSKDIYRNVKTYSKGMKRSLALAVTLAQKPKLAILDEPTAGLDVERSLTIRNIILKYNRDYGITVLLSSHNMLEVEYLCDRVGIIYKGKIITEGYIDELKTKLNAKNLEEVFVNSIRRGRE